MYIDFLGHACFLLTDARGVRIMLDPYESGGFSGRVGYAPIDEAPDVVILTHDHADHSHTEGLPGTFEVLRHAGTARGITTREVPVAHDMFEGRRFGGWVDMKIFEVDGLTVAHCGDIGELVEDDARRDLIGALDVLIVPTGGFYTLGPDGAAALTRRLKPRVVIPCHYKTSRCGFDIAPVDPFLTHFEHVIRSEDSTWTLTPDTLPSETTCLVLKMRF
ncbi:MAG: MBL fold metallo-hydrolase [Bradymonadia bacterium]